jgi:hypothetical protein
MKPGYRIIQFVWWNNLSLNQMGPFYQDEQFRKMKHLRAPKFNGSSSCSPKTYDSLEGTPTLNPKYYRTPPGHPWSQTFPGATLQPCTLQLLEARSRRMARPFSRTHSPGWTAVSFRLIRMRATENEIQ